MERCVRAARHAVRHRAKAQRRPQRGAALTRGERALRAAQHRLAPELAGRIPRLCRWSDGDLEPCREGSQHKAGLRLVNTAQEPPAQELPAHVPPRIAGPVAQPKKPRVPPPPGAWDTHAHIFGPDKKFPYAPGRGYTPSDAPAERFIALLDHLGFARGVVVQGNAHGYDNRVLLDALE